MRSRKSHNNQPPRRKKQTKQKGIYVARRPLRFGEQTAPMRHSKCRPACPFWAAEMSPCLRVSREQRLRYQTVARRLLPRDRRENDTSADVEGKHFWALPTLGVEANFLFFVFFNQLKPTALAVVFLCFYVLFCFCFFFPCMENKHKARWGCWGIRYWLHLAGGTDVTNTKGGKGRKRLLCISVETPRTGELFFCGLVIRHVETGPGCGIAKKTNQTKKKTPMLKLFRTDVQ